MRRVVAVTLRAVVAEHGEERDALLGHEAVQRGAEDRVGVGRAGWLGAHGTEFLTTDGHR